MRVGLDMRGFVHRVIRQVAAAGIHLSSAVAMQVP